MTDKMQSLALAPVGNLDSYIRAANAWPMLSVSYTHLTLPTIA